MGVEGGAELSKPWEKPQSLSHVQSELRESVDSKCSVWWTAKQSLEDGASSSKPLPLAPVSSNAAAQKIGLLKATTEVQELSPKQTQHRVLDRKSSAAEYWVEEGPPAAKQRDGVDKR